MNQLPPYLVKALRGPSRRRRRPASLVRVYRRHLNPMRRAVRRWMRTLDDAVRYGIEQQMVLGREPVPEAAPSWPRWRPKADIEKAARYTGVQLADWGCVTTKGAHEIGPHQVRIYGEAMGRAGLLAKVKTPWNVVNRHAVRWSARHVTPYMRDLVLETRQGIQRLITSGIRDGKSIAQMGREMRRLPTFAMNPRQADALIRYRGKLQGVQDRIAAALRRSGGNAAAAARDLRIKVPKAWVKRVKDGTFDIDRMVGREARKKVRYRAEMIARTETMRAVAEGTLDGYAEAQVERVRFLSSADACLECLGYDGHVYTRSEASGIIPVHPNCRCCWVPEVSVPGMVAEEGPGISEAPTDIMPAPEAPATTASLPPTRMAPSPPAVSPTPVEPVAAEPAAPVVIPAAPAKPAGSKFSTGDIASSKNLGGGVNDSQKVHIGGDGDGVYKPMSGEYKPGELRKSIPGNYAGREVAASIVDKELGLNIVPETVMKNGPVGPGSVQKWIRAKETSGLDLVAAAKDETARWMMKNARTDLTAFDILIGNTDRHLGNMLWKVNKKGQVKSIAAIDNGLAFPTNKAVDAAGELRLAFTDTDVHAVFPSKTVNKLRRFRKKREAVTEKLRGYITDDEIDSMWQRCDALIDSSQNFGKMSGYMKDAMERYIPGLE